MRSRISSSVRVLLAARASQVAAILRRTGRADRKLDWETAQVAQISEGANKSWCARPVGPLSTGVIYITSAMAARYYDCGVLFSAN
jgi:hypothetical protein